MGYLYFIILYCRDISWENFSIFTVCSTPEYLMFKYIYLDRNKLFVWFSKNQVRCSGFNWDQIRLTNLLISCYTWMTLLLWYSLFIIRYNILQHTKVDIVWFLCIWLILYSITILFGLIFMSLSQKHTNIHFVGLLHIALLQQFFNFTFLS